MNLDTSHAVLHDVNPCFRKVEGGTFFRGGSYAIYSKYNIRVTFYRLCKYCLQTILFLTSISAHNLTLGNIMELQLDFRSDSMNGMLFAFIPKKSSKYPSFVIYLEDGKVLRLQYWIWKKIRRKLKCLLYIF
jgi:hypothetical protein